MNNNQPKKMKNSFHLRIYDLEVLKSLNELFATGNYESMNEFLNYALSIGVEKIYLELGKRKLLTQDREIPELPDSKKLERLISLSERHKIMLEDTMILMNSVEGLVASVYAVQRAEVSGEPMSTELMDSAYLTKLPPAYQDIKDNLEQRFNRKLKKEQEDK